MHSDVSKLNWCVLGMVKDTSEVYIFKYLRDLDRDSRFSEVPERKNFWAKYLVKLSMHLDRIWYAVETCWFDEPPPHFISSNQYSKDRTLLLEFCERKKKLTGECLGLLISFKLGMRIDIAQLLCLIPGGIFFTFIQGHSWQRSQKNNFLHLMSLWILMKFCMLP